MRSQKKEWMEWQGSRTHRGNLESGIEFSSARKEKNRELDTLGHEQVIISFPLEK
jgi:hypothetical protein